MPETEPEIEPIAPAPWEYSLSIPTTPEPSP